jgi:hypothetical protein
MRLEDAQPAPHLLFIVADENGDVVKRMKAPAKKRMEPYCMGFSHITIWPG